MTMKNEGHGSMELRESSTINYSIVLGDNSRKYSFIHRVNKGIHSLLIRTGFLSNLPAFNFLLFKLDELLLS